MDARTADIERADHGVKGQNINVLHENQLPGTKTIDNSSLHEHTEEKTSDQDVEISPEGQTQKSPDAANAAAQTSTPFKRDITFADEVQRQKSADLSNSDRVPEQRPTEQHITFVENQRNPKDDTALRIPGPMDFERGERPHKIQQEGGQEYQRRESVRSEDSPAEKFKNTEADTKVTGNEEDASHGLSNRHDLLHLPHIRHRRGASSLDIRARAHSFQSFVSRTFTQPREETDPLPYLSYAATIGRNSAFVDLTEEQREELGGIEYRSLKTLAWVLIAYNVGWTIFGIIVYLPWILHSSQYAEVVRNDGQSIVWWGLFTPTSHFTDLGFTLTPDSMISFQTAVMPMLVGSFLIVIGNTGFPCMLRLTIWIGHRITTVGSGLWEEFRFLLDHPRRCFTLLFPRRATWWLFTVLVLLNGIDVIFFIILDLKDPTVTSLPPGFQFLDGLYQAASTRTAGFACVNLADLHPGIQVSYMVMMYISVFPIAISVRQTNVYEEKSLGIYHRQDSQPDEDQDEDGESGARSYLGMHLRAQLSFDLWFIFLGLFLICVIEGGRIQDATEPGFTVWTVLFEIVSAYGTVGLSLGYPNTNASFSAQFKPLSKLIMITMMLRGRHRGLPYALDRAILLPGEGLMNDNVRRKSAATGPGVREGVAVVKHDPDERKIGKGRGTWNLVKIVTGALSAGPVQKAKRG
jgi:potassium uptake Trk family protein